VRATIVRGDLNDVGTYLHVDAFGAEGTEFSSGDSDHFDQGDVLDEFAGLAIPGRHDTRVGGFKVRVNGGVRNNASEEVIG